jgi:hypothetical protein
MGEFEEDARRIVEKVLGVAVVRYDHNIGRSVPDLYIDYPDREGAFIEVVADNAQEQWRSLERVLEHGNRVIKVPGLKHNWWVVPKVDAQIKKTLEPQLPAVLKLLDQAGETFGHRRDSTLRRRVLASQFGDQINAIGIYELVAAEQATAEAEVRYILPGAGGPSAHDFDRLVSWCGEFLGGPGRADVRRKLAATDASERHAFVAVNMSSEWAVQHALSHDGYGLLPSRPPDLPPEVTHLWLLGTGGLGRCIAWLPDRGGWIDYEFGSWHTPNRI